MAVLLSWLGPNGEACEATARVCRVAEDELTVVARRPVSEGQLIGVCWDERQGRATAVSCREERAEYQVVLSSPLEEMRREVRQAVSGGAMLYWREPSRGWRTSGVAVRNLSPSGLQLVCPQALAVPQTVRIVGQSFECIGVVRYCEPTGDDFRLGIEFTTRPAPKGQLRSPLV